MIGKLTKFFSRGGVPAGPNLRLAAFGKHPGWDDHIDDVGVDTERMVQVKKTLYIEGISQNIDSAGWEQLSEQQLLATFDHRFLWRWSGEAAVGLMWSSSDGKGRKRYPMIVCLSGTGISSGWLCDVGMAGLGRLQARCLSATTAQGVKDAVAEVNQELLAAATSTDLLAENDPDADLLAAMAARAVDPAQRQGLTRVLYQIDQKMTSFRADVPKTRTRSIDMTARQFRVPLIGGTSAFLTTTRAWQAVILDALRADAALAAGVLGIEAISGGHADLVVGQPTSRNFFCLRASKALEPLTTDIPFGIDPSFEERVNATIERWRTRGRPSV